MIKMWEARHYKARLEETMTTLKMSGCVSPLESRFKIRLKRTSLPKQEDSHNGWYTKVFNFSKMFNPSTSVRGPFKLKCLGAS